MPTHIEIPQNEQERQSLAEQWFKDKFKHDMLYDPEFVASFGLAYHGIGRPVPVGQQ